MPFSTNLTGPEQEHIAYSNAWDLFANGYIKPGFDGNPPTGFYDAHSFPFTQATNNAMGVRPIMANQLGEGTAPQSYHYLGGDQKWRTLPLQYVPFERAGNLVTVTSPVFEFTPEETIVIVAARARLKTAPATTAAIFDVQKNGLSIQSTKLQVAAGANRGNITFSGLASVCVAGDHVTVLCTQTGTSPNFGADLSVQYAFRALPNALAV